MKKSYHHSLNKIKKETRYLSWKLVYNDFRPANESLREALCTVGNGYFGTRGAAPESAASRMHYPGTYIAGTYNTLSTNIAGKVVNNEDFVNCPNWLPLSFKTEKDGWIIPTACKILYYRQQLDMYKGVLSRIIRFRTANDYTFTIESQRIAHMGDPHIASIRYVIKPEDYEGMIIVRSGLDGTVENKGVGRYRQLNSKHLKSRSVGRLSANKIQLTVKTNQSNIIISQAARTCVFVGEKELHPKSSVTIKHKKAIYQDFSINVQPGKTYEVEKIVAIYTSNDKRIADPQKACVKGLKPHYRFKDLLASHEKAWSSLWKKFDINIQGNETFNKILRLHSFHLLQSASSHNVNIDAGLPARGLHGEAYRGHIFWDQLFVLPFYNLHLPEVSKSILLYRYRRLEQARKNAKEEGFLGAMFPWQSASKGDEQTQSIHLNPISGKWGPDHSRMQRHISFDIAYNVYRYWQETDDMNFMVKYGAEILLSIAQLGSSISMYSSLDRRYHTEGLMGPDEFHERLPGNPHAGFRDNTFTNFLIVTTLRNALKLLEAIPRRSKKILLKKLAITEKELERWRDITKKMNIIINKDGILAQFEGYFGLKELNWERYGKKYGNIHRMDRILKAEGKSPNDYKVAKQADVLMIFYMFTLREVKETLKELGYKLDREIFRKNYDYYIKRTSHGSTLSKVVHCYLAHLLNRPTDTWRMYMDVLRSDIFDIQGGTTLEGIHTGVMGGSIDIAIRSFAGVNTLEDCLKLSPWLPKNWRSIKLRLLYRGRWIFLAVSRRRINIFISSNRKGPMPIEIYGKRRILKPGKMHKIELKRGIPMIAREGIVVAGHERILIVDGDMMQATQLKTRLQALGYLVDYAHGGNEALEILRTGWVDLIITAVSLEEGMSGYQLFKEIRQRDEYTDIPIIVAGKKPGMKKLFKKMGAKEFFARPYSVETLIKKIHKIMSGNA